MNINDRIDNLKNKGSAPAANAASSNNNKKKSQYWGHVGFIADLAKLREHDQSGVAYLFEMGFALDDLKDKLERNGKTESFNNLIALKNTLRIEIIDIMKDLEVGEWKVICPNNVEPIEGDVCLVIRKIDPENSGVSEESVRKAVKKTSCTF